MDRLDPDLAQLDEIPVLERDVLPHVRQAVREHLGGGLVREALQVRDVVRVVVRDEDHLHRQTVLGGEPLDGARVEARVHDGGLLRGGVPNQVAEVRERPDFPLGMDDVFHESETPLAPMKLALPGLS